MRKVGYSAIAISLVCRISDFDISAKLLLQVDVVASKTTADNGVLRWIFWAHATKDDQYLQYWLPHMVESLRLQSEFAGEDGEEVPQKL